MRSTLLWLSVAWMPTAAAFAQCPTAQFVLAPTSDSTLPANQSVRVGDSPNEVAIGFFNGDAIPDLATAESSGETLSVRLGVGDGTFINAPVPTITFPAGQIPRSIAAGDFDEDGREDLVVVTLNGVVFVLEGQGDGTFRAPVDVVGLGPSNNTRMIVAQFAGDDHLDLAISLELQNDVEILLGDGEGRFTRAGTLSVPAAIGLTAGQFSGSDLVTDLAVVSRTNRTVTIFEGEAGGSFDEGDTLSISTNPDLLSSGITAGDFDGDGDQDLAALSRLIGTTSPSENVQILEGGNNGSFLPGPQFDSGFGPNQVETADLNRDGRLDLAIASTGNREASVLLGQPDGTFGPRFGFAAGGNPLDIAVADLDGNGAPDLVTVNQASDSLSVYLNACTCLPSNAAPTISANTAIAQQGSLPRLTQVATVTDPDGPDDALAVRLVSSTSISVTDFSNAGGTVSAQIAPACTTPVGFHDLVLEVFDGCRTATDTLRIEVTADTPPIAPTETSRTVPFGSSGSEILTPLASDNGTFQAQLVMTPDTFAGTGSYDPLSGELTIHDAAPVGTYIGELTLTDQCGLSTSATYGLTVIPAASTTTASSDAPDPSQVGQSFDVDWSVDVVAPGVAVPTGLVTVADGAESCSAAVSAGSCTLALNTVGARNLTVSYSGDDNVAASQTTEPHQVLAGATMTTWSANPTDRSVSGQPVDVSWSVDVVAPALGTPTGTVTVSDGDLSCSAPVDTGSCRLTLFTPGPRTLTVSYSGDNRFQASQSSAAFAVDPAQSRTEIVDAAPDPSFFGAPVTVAWTVDVVAPGTGTATGDVTISDGVASCVAPVAAGSCQLILQTVGARTLSASYTGNGNLSPSQDTEAHEVVPADTVLTVTASDPDPSRVGERVSIGWSLEVTAPGSGLPTGDVTVTDGVVSCSATFDSGGCSLVFDTAGPRTLVVAYAGDGNFASSQRTEPHQVLPGEIALAITGDSPDPSPVGAEVTITWDFAVVAPAVGNPTGLVTVGDGSRSCSAPAAVGSCSLTFDTAGLRTLTADYPVDSNFEAAQDTEPHVVGIADLRVTKTVALAEDANGDGIANPGERLAYTVEIENVGDGAAQNASMVDLVDPNAILICGEPAPPDTTSGSVTLCEPQAGGTLSVQLGTIEAGSAITRVSYQTFVGPVPPEQAITLVNQAAVNADGIGEVLSDDPTVSGNDDPTLVMARGVDAIDIPTLSEWSLILLINLLAALGLRALRR